LTTFTRGCDWGIALEKICGQGFMSNNWMEQNKAIFSRTASWSASSIITMVDCFGLAASKHPDLFLIMM